MFEYTNCYFRLPRRRSSWPGHLNIRKPIYSNNFKHTFNTDGTGVSYYLPALWSGPPSTYSNVVAVGIYIWSIWWCPEIGVPPVIIHFSRIVHEINHPAIGVPPWLWKPPYTHTSYTLMDCKNQRIDKRRGLGIRWQVVMWTECSHTIIFCWDNNSGGLQEKLKNWIRSQNIKTMINKGKATTKSPMFSQHALFIRPDQSVSRSRHQLGYRSVQRCVSNGDGFSVLGQPIECQKPLVKKKSVHQNRWSQSIIKNENLHR